MLAGLDSVCLLDTLLIAVLKYSLQSLYFLYIPIAANDIFQVLEQACLVFVHSLRFHQGDLLDLTLQNQKPVVVKIDSLRFQKGYNLIVVTDHVIKEVL